MPIKYNFVGSFINKDYSDETYFLLFCYVIYI